MGASRATPTRMAMRTPMSPTIHAFTAIAPSRFTFRLFGVSIHLLEKDRQPVYLEVSRYRRSPTEIPKQTDSYKPEYRFVTRSVTRLVTRSVPRFVTRLITNRREWFYKKHFPPIGNQ